MPFLWAKLSWKTKCAVKTRSDQAGLCLDEIARKVYFACDPVVSLLWRFCIKQTGTLGSVPVFTELAPLLG